MIKRILLIAVVISLIAAFFLSGLDRYLDFEFLQAQREALQRLIVEQPLLTMGGYFLLYVLVTALSIPGAAVMTLAGGFIFGLLWGTLLVSVASTLGATAAFLIARFLFRDSVQQRYGDRLRAVNRGIEREGAFYLFALRLVPVFPFFVINIAMGLTPIRTLTFLLVSWAGMLPATIVYVNAGTQLARIDGPGDVLSPALIASFVLLGLFPLVARRLLAIFKRRKALRGWKKPKRFDRNLIVIGAGSGGLVAALIAAAVRARVSLIERDRMGGDCLNTGCVPSKALIRSATFKAAVEHSGKLGFPEASAPVDFPAVMERVQRVIRTIEPHDSVERFESLGVDCIQGEAKIVSPWEVAVNGRHLSSRHIIIATGSSPLIPPIPGLKDVDYLTSDTLWSLREQPRRLVVLGGGPIGCELSQAFARLGSQVTQVEMASHLLGREDADVADYTRRILERDGVDVRLGHKAVKCEQRPEGGFGLITEVDGEEVTIEGDRLLVAVGRKPVTEGLGLEELGVRLNANGTIETDEFLRSSIPTIHACGDVAGPFQFTHAASHQAWHAAVNALFGWARRFRVDYRFLPWVTFTDPQVARLGLNEHNAREQGVAHEVTRYDFEGLDRAIVDESAEGFIKVLTPPGKDRILGVTIVGPQAGELISQFTLAMKNGIGLNRLLSTIYPYPTFSEANKFAAGNWKKAHAPEGVLRWLERLHAWRR
ncbi:FAD-dependent oxidoreductase [Natronospira bacteriovora]|uniref:FAD-dependent oxidoreductase n=1 Tax=Natronospira bacteriovora TaxID=3069753 RepID=A0ABU0W4F1_9GAMM|nr:bifunctional TVP38/TMEM64 family protein/FAD-dependent oxidoreductase [Natronospira sp. AB-CW4]MDQ2068900.1 FAD-dependent oxidoreductase [Natronospira sp. AB-CW4]